VGGTTTTHRYNHPVGRGRGWPWEVMGKGRANWISLIAAARASYVINIGGAGMKAGGPRAASMATVLASGRCICQDQVRGYFHAAVLQSQLRTIVDPCDLGVVTPTPQYPPVAAGGDFLLSRVRRNPQAWWGCGQQGRRLRATSKNLVGSRPEE